MTVIANACDIPINVQMGSIPDMSGALTDWFQSIQALRVRKVIVNFEVFELQTQYAFQGVLQPFTDRKLSLKPEGQRSWSWFTLHAYPSLRLTTDDMVWIQNTRYRVMALLDYSIYGYVEYHLAQDYQNEAHAPAFPNEDDITKFVRDLVITEPELVTIDVSATIPDARDAMWSLYDTGNGNQLVSGAVQILNSTQVQIEFLAAGTFRLIGAY